MPPDSNKTAKELYEFGPFRVDAEREILLRSDDPVALPPKAFQVLLVLVRHNQQVVTKDDLLKEVWPDTFVEETNLSRNIFLLRKALGEAPEDHRYILTVPGRGYRLAESVRLVPEKELSIVSASQTKVQIEIAEKKQWAWVALCAGALLIAAVGTWWVFRYRKPLLKEKDSVVLVEFANSTGDSVFDATLRQGLEVQLTQSPYLILISDEYIQHTLELMGRSGNAALTPQIGSDICIRTGSAAVLEGSIAKLGSQYILGLRAKDCRNGIVLDEEQGQSATKENVINVLSEMAARFRNRVGESLATIERHNTPLQEATTPSLDALQAFSLGWKSSFGPSGPGEALPFFKRAVEIDPNFASAYAMLGRLYAEMGENSLALENTSKAYELRSRATDPERFFIELNYEMLVTGNLEKARQTAELWTRTYPLDAKPLGLLSVLYQELGRHDKSIEAGKADVKIGPDFVPGYANLAWAYLLSDRLNDAEETVQLVKARGLEFPDLYILLYDIAFLRNNQAGMSQAMEAAEGKSSGENWIKEREACVLAYNGRLHDSETTSRRAMQLADQAEQPERAELYQAGIATRKALLGDTVGGRKAALDALKRSKDRDVMYGAAFALALAGDEGHTKEVIESLKRRFPEDTYVIYSYVPTLQAILEEKQGDPVKALQELEPEIPYDFAIAGSWAGFFGDMYPVYVRGLAYFQAHRYQEAILEFRKITGHRGLVGSDPVGAVAQLQLARAYKSAGNMADSKAAYLVFLDLWKNADSDSRLLEAANTEFASSF